MKLLDFNIFWKCTYFFDILFWKCSYFFDWYLWKRKKCKLC